MAARVRTFSRAHPSTDPEYTIVLGRLEERLTRAEAIAGKQHEGLVSAKNARNRREELRRVVRFQLLRYLIAVGGIAAKSRTEAAERFKLPHSKASHRVFLTAVKSMLATAEAQKDALVGEGMSPRLLEDLGRMVAEFETASEAARTARLDHIGARADLEEATAELVEQVKVLDGLNRWRFGKEPELLVEWNAAKHVAGAGQSRVSPPPAGEGVTPPTSGGVAPAA
ncbi:MAG TPA: hypothetical protein VGQ17_02960 [Gemmatimonadales bacterium]|jgi:hypothetical protein|nr:hypothetical protein [Gemmatimonadales bacterium]